jgi:hypothetical protein
MSDDAKIPVLKITAAQRQLDAAIRMYFSNEDALATYTVAAASNRILRDLVSVAGGSPATHILHQAFNYHLEHVVSTLDYTLREEGLDLPASMMHEAAAMASKRALLDISQIPNIDKQLGNFLNTPANFLKHADRDTHAVMSEDEIQIEPVLDSACALYVYLMAEHTPEMHTFYLYRSIGERIDLLPAWEEAQRSKLARVPVQRRGKACILLIAEMKRRAKTRPIPRSS